MIAAIFELIFIRIMKLVRVRVRARARARVRRTHIPPKWLGFPGHLIKMTII